MSLAAIRPVAVLPTFNNARTLAVVIGEVLKTGVPVIVVDDGCTDATRDVLDQFQGEIRVVRHAKNRGKAAALRTGFVAARDAGFTHAIVVDTDGQLDPLQIPQFVACAQKHPEALILGVRDDRKQDYPSGSRTGRRVSNLLVWIESGLKISDSQCGFRVYPLDFITAVKCPASRFGFETEILTRAGWSGCKSIEIPVSCTYSPAGGRISHFRPWVDSFRAVFMHARLIARAIWPWPHVKWPPESEEEKVDWWHWINPQRLWRELRDEHEARSRLALAIGVGVLIANLPIYPGQTVTSIYVARRLHLNPLAVVLGSQLSTPPVSFILIAAAIFLGHFLLHGAPLSMSLAHMHQIGAWKMAGSFILDWILGGIILGLVLGSVAFGLCRALFACIPLSNQKQTTESAA